MNRHDPRGYAGDHVAEPHVATHYPNAGGVSGGNDPLDLQRLFKALGGSEGDILVWQTVGGKTLLLPYSLVVPGAAGLLNVLGVANGETVPTWKTSEHNLLSIRHSDAVAAAAAQGALISGQDLAGTPAWQLLAAPSDPSILNHDGTDALWDDMAWTQVSFSAGDFTASGGATWTVGSGDVLTHKYRLIGDKTMIVSFMIATTTVARSGANPVSLQIAVPAGRSAASAMVNACYVIDNGVAAPGWIQVQGSTISITRVDAAQWQNATNTTYVYGEITFEVS